jgi:hypothetical protein
LQILAGVFGVALDYFGGYDDEDDEERSGARWRNRNCANWWCDWGSTGQSARCSALGQDRGRSPYRR